MLQVKAGNHSAFRDIYSHFKVPVIAYAFQLTKNQPAAEEIAQETFLRIYRARASYEPTAKFSTFLWTVARNAAFDFKRKKKEVLWSASENEEGEAGESPLEKIESPLSDAEAQLIERGDHAHFEECMQELSPNQRDALSLRVLSDLSYEEISVAVNTSLSSVKSLLFRAREALMDCMKKGESQYE